MESRKAPNAGAGTSESQPRPRVQNSHTLAGLETLKTLHESYLVINTENTKIKKANRNMKYDLEFYKDEVKRFQTETSGAKKEAERLRNLIVYPELKDDDLEEMDCAHEALDEAGKVMIRAQKVLEFGKGEYGDAAVAACLKKFQDQWQRQKDAGLFDYLRTSDTSSDGKKKSNDENRAP